jgi:hypothetical protein
VDTIIDNPSLAIGPPFFLNAAVKFN